MYSIRIFFVVVVIFVPISPENDATCVFIIWWSVTGLSQTHTHTHANMKSEKHSVSVGWLGELNVFENSLLGHLVLPIVV